MCASVDPAIEVLEELISCDYEAARTRVIVSGASSSCSQKIHNLQRGILKASQDSKYVLCLDDDVQLHPGFLQMAVSHMEADSAAFMLTGQSPSAAHIHPPPRLPTPFSFQHRGGGGGCGGIKAGNSSHGKYPTLQFGFEQYPDLSAGGAALHYTIATVHQRQSISSATGGIVALPCKVLTDSLLVV